MVIAVADRLEELELSTAQLTDCALMAASKLHYLSIGGWRNVSKRAIAAVAGRIRTLKLRACPISDDMLAPLARSPQLQELDLSALRAPSYERNILTDAGLKRALAARRIRTLNLQGRSKLTGSFLAALTSLETLNVSFCPLITADAVVPLAGHLRRLEHHYSGIRMDGLAMLSSADRAHDVHLAAEMPEGRSHKAA